MECRIECADVLEFLDSVGTGSVDLVLTSPPYNVGKEYEVRTSLAEYLAWQEKVIVGLVRVVREGGAICYQVGNYVKDGAVWPLDCLLFPAFLRHGLSPRSRVVWTFGHGLHSKRRYSGRHETLLWFTKGEGYTFNLDLIRVPQKYPGKKHYKGDRVGQLSGNPLGKNPSDV